MVLSEDRFGDLRAMALRWFWMNRPERELWSCRKICLGSENFDKFQLTWWKQWMNMLWRCLYEYLYDRQENLQHWKLLREFQSRIKSCFEITPAEWNRFHLIASLYSILTHCHTCSWKFSKRTQRCPFLPICFSTYSFQIVVSELIVTLCSLKEHDDSSNPQLSRT